VRLFRVIDAPQRSPEWFAARLGRLTGSVAGDMLARTKSGWSASRRNLMLRLVLERLTNKSAESDFVSAAMQTGIDREPLAVAAYEAITGDVLSHCGFVQHTVVMAGASPDGYVGDFAKVVSIKCRQPAAHLEFIRSGVIPPDALAQIRHELWITGAAAADYFCWNPDFPVRLESRIKTVTRAEADIPEYEQEAMLFLAEVQNEYEALRTASDLSAVLEETA
jgi:hypothetical protein